MKQVDLAKLGEDPKRMYIVMDLTEQEERDLINLLKEFKDVFAWK